MKEIRVEIDDEIEADIFGKMPSFNEIIFPKWKTNNITQKAYQNKEKWGGNNFFTVIGL